MRIGPTPWVRTSQPCSVSIGDPQLPIWIASQGCCAFRSSTDGLSQDRTSSERILADLPYPVLQAEDEERDGYVPNVVYSCGAMLHGDHLVLPYGASDQRTAFATLSVSELLAALADHPVPENRVVDR